MARSRGVLRRKHRRRSTCIGLSMICLSACSADLDDGYVKLDPEQVYAVGRFGSGGGEGVFLLPDFADLDIPWFSQWTWAVIDGQGRIVYYDKGRNEVRRMLAFVGEGATADQLGETIESPCATLGHHQIDEPPGVFSFYATPKGAVVFRCGDNPDSEFYLEGGRLLPKCPIGGRGEAVGFGSEGEVLCPNGVIDAAGEFHAFSGFPERFVSAQYAEGSRDVLFATVKAIPGGWRVVVVPPSVGPEGYTITVGDIDYAGVYSPELVSPPLFPDLWAEIELVCGDLRLGPSSLFFCSHIKPDGVYLKYRLLEAKLPSLDLEVLAPEDGSAETLIIPRMRLLLD